MTNLIQFAKKGEVREMTDDLVKRLRDLVNDDDTEMLAWQAADRIEQLEAALDDVATHLPRAEWHYLKDETLITIGEKRDVSL